MHNKKGIYIHIPFCEKKCAYCDFYSSFPTETVLKEYLSSLKSQIKKWGGDISCPIDTVYIGGGTPSLLGDEIIPLMKCITDNFDVDTDAEITAELNPLSADRFLRYAKAAGINRISIGVQSGSDISLKVLGRAHTATDSVTTVKAARKLGFDNISVDLMIGLPDSSIKTLDYDIDFLLSLNPDHISAYILKVEENTAFAKMENTLNLPDDDEVADQYLHMCARLENAGFSHYEISNFCKNDKQSRHNMKYWTDGEYLGIGPSAHSYINRSRFYYPRNLKEFILNPQTVFDGIGGERAEKIMLGLRLAQGVDLSTVYNPIPEKIISKIFSLEKAGYLNVKLPRVSLTDSGMLISNSIITELTI